MPRNFLGDSPQHYKLTILAFLAINPILFFGLPLIGVDGGFWAGWALLLQFIYTLAMALRCYPLQPGGLLAIEAFILGMADPHSIYHEIEANLEVILLLMFMVAAIYFLKDLLLYVFSNLLVRIRSKYILSVLIMLLAAVLSAFLDALTVTAALLTATAAFSTAIEDHLATDIPDYQGSEQAPPAIAVAERLALVQAADEARDELHSYMRNLLMHGLIGTAVGGVSTIVGEPQNLLIANMVGWDFIEFARRMAPVTAAVLIGAPVLCVLMEKLSWFGYGSQFPEMGERSLLTLKAELAEQGFNTKLKVQAFVALLLCIALVTHVAAIGVIGLGAIILLTSINGKVKEEEIAPAFHEAMPFTALLVVFFSIIAIIHEQDLFAGITHFIFNLGEAGRPALVFGATGILSMISDNVFVAAVYVAEIGDAWKEGIIGREEYEMLAVAVNAGTNLPSVATPNGQAAFLFALTSSVAPRLGLSYLYMVKAAIPYTLVLSLLGAGMVQWLT